MFHPGWDEGIQQYLIVAPTLSVLVSVGCLFYIYGRGVVADTLYLVVLTTTIIAHLFLIVTLGFAWPFLVAGEFVMMFTPGEGFEVSLLGGWLPFLSTLLVGFAPTIKKAWGARRVSETSKARS